MFNALFTMLSNQPKKSASRKSSKTGGRRLRGEMLEERQMLSGSGFSLSAAGQAAIVNDAKALHLSNAEVTALVIVDAVAKVQHVNLSPTAIASARGITTAEKIELAVINANLSYSQPSHVNYTIGSAQQYQQAALNLAYQTPGEVDAWLNSDSSDLYSTPVDLGEL